MNHQINIDEAIAIAAEVIDMIIKDFYPNYNKDGNKIF